MSRRILWFSLLPLLGSMAVSNADPFDEWTNRIPAPVSGIQAIGFTDGRFLVGEGGKEIWSSTSGLDWQVTGKLCGTERVAFGNGVWVTTDNSCIESSVDLTNWTSVELPGSAIALAFGNGLFVAPGPGLQPSQQLPRGKVPDFYALLPVSCGQQVPAW